MTAHLQMMTVMMEALTQRCRRQTSVISLLRTIEPTMTSRSLLSVTNTWPLDTVGQKRLKNIADLMPKLLLKSF